MPPRKIVPREPSLPLDQPLPRHWLADNAVATAIANGVNLLFPAGERFFIRSVSPFLSAIDAPELRAQARAFFAQEGQHARAHDQVIEQLEAQGFDARRFLRFYELVTYGITERLLTQRLRLAATAATEHFTALLAEDVFRGGWFAHSDPTMGALFRWHAAEEIEHRAVAYDVLREVSPSYALRVAGLLIATAYLGGFWLAASGWLLWHDRKLGLKRLREDFRRMQANRIRPNVFGRGIRAYLRRDFHPLQSDLDALAQDYLRSVGMASA